VIDLKLKFLSEQLNVLEAANRANAKCLSKFGAFVMTRDRQSIRDRKAISNAGDPPSSHTKLLKRHIYFQVESNPPNVVIGPALINSGSAMTLAAIEGGGPSLVKLSRYRNGQKQSITRPIVVKARPHTKPAFDKEIEKSPKLWQDCLAAAS
jgi:predicted amino acid dehydrogenase